MQEEKWLPVKGHEGIYEVSDLGRVKSLDRKVRHSKKGFLIRKGKILSSNSNKSRYILISLSKKGLTETKAVHKLVAISFLNHTPCGNKLVVNHINHNRLDNRVENLEIITNRENSNKKHLKSTSKYTGVSWSKKSRKWTSSISINGKHKNLGCFNTELEASLIYESALKNILNGESL